MTKHLVSIGYLCQQFQRSHFAIMQSLVDAGIYPEMTLNLIAYYDFDTSFRTLENKPAVQMIEGIEQ